MNGHGRKYATANQELLAGAKALDYWRCYLEGAPKVTVNTDHKPNAFLTSKPAVQLTSRQVRWQEFLSRSDFSLEYVKGEANEAKPLTSKPALLSTAVAHRSPSSPHCRA